MGTEGRLDLALTCPESASRVALGIVEGIVLGRVDDPRGRIVVVGVIGRPMQERDVVPFHAHVDIAFAFHRDRSRDHVQRVAGRVCVQRGRFCRSGGICASATCYGMTDI